MKKLLLISMALLAMLMMTGCETTEPATEPEGTHTAVPSETLPTETHLQDAEAEEIEPVVYYTQQGCLTPETSGDTATVWANGTAPGEVYTDVYLEVVTDGIVLTYDLGEWDHHVLPEGTFSLADLDGNGTDEMILIMTVTGNGGALAQVFGVRDNEIVLLWDLDDVPLGITIQYCDGYTMVLENATAGFSLKVEMTKELWPDKFDEHGKYTGSFEIYVDPISQGFVEPATAVESPRISCVREISYTDINGSLTVVFQYDPVAGVLKPVEMEFESRSFS